MSKNFELLQQIGNEKELFQTGCQVEDCVFPEDAERNPGAAAEDPQNRFLRSASLPDVFEPVGLASGTLAGLSDLNMDIYEESGSIDGRETFAEGNSRSTGNSASLIIEPGEQIGNRVAEKAAENGSVLNQFSASADTETSPAAASCKSLHDKGKETPEVILGRFSPSFPWVEGVKTAAKRWGSRLQSRNNRSGVDLAVIAREEEIKLVQRIFPGTADDSPRVGLFASVDAKVGCASICVRAGEILAARAEGPVCLVDANFQLPTLHECFGVENERGLAEATRDSGPIQEFVQRVSGADLWMMTTGKLSGELDSPGAADALRTRLTELRDTFRYVVIHSGPLQLESRAMLLSRWADGVVLVLEANSTRRDTARRAKENLAAARVTLLGVVLNNRIFPIPEPIYRWL